MNKLLFTICLIMLIKGTFAQQSFTLSGLVKDKKNEVLPGTGIYVSGYKIGTATDNNGAYSLSLKPGNYDILVQIMGYKAINRNVLIEDKPVKLDFILEESAVQLSEVTVKPDPDRAFHMGIFRDFFIGTTPNAKLCKIMNAQILNFDYDQGILKTKTEEFLIIENQALGYRIKYLINGFEYNSKTRIIYYEGYPYYEDIKASKSKMKRWSKKRIEAYNGSSQHFLRSLYNGTSKAEGFEINKLSKINNTNRASDSLINSNLKRLKTTQTGLDGIVRIRSNDSLSYWNRERNKPQQVSILNRQEVLPDTLVHTFNESIKSFNFKDVLYVIYKGEKENPEFASRIGNSVSRPLDMPNYQISLINLLIAPVYFYQNGSVYNPRSMLFEGYWSWEKVADSVPMDYLPPATGK